MSELDHVVLFGAAFLLPLAGTMLFTPVAAVLARRIGVLDLPDGRKVHVEATPYLGGLAVVVGLVVAGVVIGSTARQATVIAACALAIFLLGLFDDVRGLGRVSKVGVEAGLAIILWSADVRAGFFGIPVLDLVLTIAWVVVIVNAVNLLDNMDGLASGVSVIASLAYFVIAAAQGDYLVASLAAAVAGTSVGFLRHNFPPARIFLGDAGSLLLGLLLAALGLLMDLEGPSNAVRIGVQALILGVPVFDTALVVVARWRGGRPITLGGTDHSSHRLSRVGLSGRQVAFVIYAGQLAASSLAVALVNAPSVATSVALAWLSIGTAVGVMVALRGRRATVGMRTIVASTAERRSPGGPASLRGHRTRATTAERPARSRSPSGP
jgi:UDP-GlcNAc:undecaprenyl-phosphate GlcNAc-1-phosphate transferase